MKVPCLSADGGELVGEIYCSEVIDSVSMLDQMVKLALLLVNNKRTLYPSTRGPLQIMPIDWWRGQMGRLIISSLGSEQLIGYYCIAHHLSVLPSVTKFWHELYSKQY